MRARSTSRDSRARARHLAGLFAAAGLVELEETTQTVRSEFATFDEWWEPYTLGVGPAGAHAAGLDPELQERVREACRVRLPEPPFTVTATAWAVRGIV